MLEKNQESLLKELMISFFSEGLNQYTKKIQQMTKRKLKNEITELETSWERGKAETDVVMLCLACYYYEKRFNKKYRLKGETQNVVNNVFSFINNL